MFRRYVVDVVDRRGSAVRRRRAGVAAGVWARSGERRCRAGPVAASTSSCIKAMSSHARVMSSHQIWFWWSRVGADGPGRRPWLSGCGPQARARRRWCSSRSGSLATLGVGDEAGEAVAVDVGEAQLRARVRVSPADDDAHAFGPGGEVEHAGDLGDPRAGPYLGVGVAGGRPGGLGQTQDRLLDVVGKGVIRGVAQPESTA